MGSSHGSMVHVNRDFCRPPEAAPFLSQAGRALSIKGFARAAPGQPWLGEEERGGERRGRVVARYTGR